MDTQVLKRDAMLCAGHAACPGCIDSVFWVRSIAWIWDFVRHEALRYRMEVKRLHPRSVAAGRGS